MSFIDLHTNVSLGHTKIVGLGGEKLWLCPTLGGDKLDISGNGNHGTYNGGMSTVADVSNGGTRAYSFDGSNDYIDCGEVVVTSEIGISLWMKRNEVSNFVSVVTKYDSSVGASSPFSPYYVMSSVSGNGIRGYVGTASTSSFKAEEYTSTVANNSWSHVAISSSLGSNKINIFIDGSFVTSNTLANSTFSSVSSGSGIKTLIGARQNSSSVERFLNGYLDDIRIFDRALTTTEITHLATKRGVLGSPKNPVIKKRRIFYAPTAPVTTTAKAVVLKKPKPSYATGYARNASESANPNLWKGLVGAWMPSFGVTGETLKDVSGNGNDGTLNNMDAASDWVATSKGLALDFDGSNDYVIASYQASPEITVVSNVKFDSFIGASVTKNWGDNLRGAFHLDASQLGSGYLALFIYAGSQISIKDPTQLSTGKWYQVGLRITNSKYQIIRDGNIVAEGSHAGLSILDRPNLGIGVKLNNDGTAADTKVPKYLDGQISNVVAYKRALSPTEIKQLYLNPAAPFERKQQTVGISTAQAFNPYWANQATQLAGTLQ